MNSDKNLEIERTVHQLMLPPAILDAQDDCLDCDARRAKHAGARHADGPHVRTNLNAREAEAQSPSHAERSEGLGDAGAAVDERFFFQAEDGIRDYKVTGVQTCALPI